MAAAMFDAVMSCPFTIEAGGAPVAQVAQVAHGGVTLHYLSHACARLRVCGWNRETRHHAPPAPPDGQAASA